MSSPSNVPNAPRAAAADTAREPGSRPAHRWWVPVLLLVLYAPFLSAQTERFQLGNGLTVVLREDHTEKRVAVESLYRAGFIHEPKGKAHIAHITEHMVCCCPTKSFGPREAATRLQRNGMANAETLASFVHYDYIVPSTDLALALRIEAERLTSIRFTDTVLKQEVPRAVGEIDIVERNPQAGVLKFGLIGLCHVLRFQDTFVPIHANPSRFTRTDVEQFHAAHYRIDEGVLTIVGDFDTASAKEMVQREFGAIPKPPPRPPIEIHLDQNRAATWDLRANTVYLVCPCDATDANARLTLTLLGNYLSMRLWQDANLKGMTKNRFCSTRGYPVGEMPFFVFA